MKHFTFFLFLICILSSCQPLNDVRGTYSYKISGVVKIDGEQVSLDDEQGALEMVVLNEEDLLLTFNQLGGGVYVAECSLGQANELTIHSYERVLSLLQDGEIIDIQVSAQGKGKLYDNTLIIDLEYSGKSLSKDPVHYLSVSNVTLVAKRN